MCNCIRAKLLEKYKLPDTFELSQTFVFFYDKLERVNYFLEHIIETRSEVSDEVREMAKFEMATSTTKLTHQIRFFLAPSSLGEGA
tara:strand:+ start:549 stop:806 length:258 start_codon:yes stop_codon:yes gene_type:complete